LSRRRGLWLLFGCEVVLTGGLALSMPFMALYLSRDRGVSVGMVGLLLSATLLCVAVSQGVGGELSDARGRRSVMFWAMAWRTALTLALGEGVRRGLAPTAIIALYMAGAFAGNLYGPASRGWIADRCVAAERVRAYGLLRTGTNLGWAIGPALGGALAERSYAALFYATAAACALCAAAVGLFLEDSAASRVSGFSLRAAAGALSDPRLRRFCLGAGLIGIAMSSLVVPLSVHAAKVLGLGEAQVGRLFSVNGIVVVLSQWWVSGLLSRFRITSALAGGSLVYALAYLLVASAGGFAALALAVAVASLGEIAVSPGLHAMAANLAPETLRGRYLGLASFAHLTGFAAAPALAGVLMERVFPRHPGDVWCVVAAVAVAAALAFRVLRASVRLSEEGLLEASAAGAL